MIVAANNIIGGEIMVISYIQAHWTEWLFATVLAVLTYGYKKVLKRLSEEQKKNAAISDGVQALLRESIVGNYNKYMDKGFCPIYAKESMKKAYKAYSALGGNDVATELYRKVLAMPEEGET